ncbi:14793_t:CDS:2 [Gigaspora rosea]|nr:14793_t:CDS:2 [Gigaspora rosea]
MDSSTHDKVKKNITTSKWAPQNREQTTSHQRRGRSPYKFDEMNYIKSSLYNGQENTKFTHGTNNSQLLPERKLLEEILKRLSNLERKRLEQQSSKEHSTSPFQTSEQILASCDNSAANNRRENTFTAPKIDQVHEEQTEVHQMDQIWDIIVNSIKEATNTCLPKRRLQYSSNNKRGQKKEKMSKTYKAIVQISRWIKKGKKNQNQKIDTNPKEEMTCSIRKINKKLNIKIAEIGDHWSSELIQDLKG